MSARRDGACSGVSSVSAAKHSTSKGAGDETRAEKDLGHFCGGLSAGLGSAHSLQRSNLKLL